LLRQSRDANRVSDMATLTSALNLYLTDQGVGNGFSLGNASNTAISVPDPNNSSTCGSLGLPALNTGQQWYCGSSTSSRNINNTGWIPVNLSSISAGSPIGSLPVDPTNQTSSGLFYAYNTNGTQFEVTANLESSKYKTQYGNTPQTSLFPEVISGGTPTVSQLYNPSGLVGYWPLNEGSGSSTIDASGNGNAGTWAGTTSGNNSTYYTGGKVGTYAGNFNGSNDYVNLGNPTALQVTSSLSVVAWVNQSAVVSFGNVMVGNYWSGSGAFVVQDYGSNNMLCSYLGNTKTVATPTNSFNTGIWYYIGCTYNGSTITTYINGVNSGSIAATGTLSNSSGYPWYIGTEGSVGFQTGFFHGSIDDVRIYSRALSPAEVMALYTAEK